MAGKINWSKASYERKMRDQGIEPHDDFLPKPNDGVVPKSQQSPASKGKLLHSPKVQKNRDKALQQAKCRENYIAQVRRAIFEEKEPPAPFKKLSPAVMAQISKAPNVQAWAKRQPEYANAEKAALLLKSQDKFKSTQQWRATLNKDISRIEAELRKMEQRGKILRDELRSKKKALSALD